MTKNSLMASIVPFILVAVVFGVIETSSGQPGPGYELGNINGKTYYLVNRTSYDWAEARYWCQNYYGTGRGELATIESEEETVFIANFYKATDLNSTNVPWIWISANALGSQDLSSMSVGLTWASNDQHADYQNWAPPSQECCNYVHAWRRCVAAAYHGPVYGGGTIYWRIWDCREKLPILCQLRDAAQ